MAHVLEMAWTAPVCGTRQVREGVGNRVANRAGSRRQRGRSCQEQKVEQSIGQEVENRGEDRAGTRKQSNISGRGRTGVALKEGTKLIHVPLVP